MSRVTFETEKNLPFLRGVARSLTDENARLRARLAAMESELAREAKERAEAQASAAEAAAVAAEWEAAAATWQQELQLVREQLAQRERALYGKKSERRPPADQGGGGDGKDGEGEKKKRPRKRQKGHGRTAQPELEVVEVVHTLPDEKLVCDGCGGALTEMGTAEAAELVALEERKIVLERHLRTKYACRCCRTGIVVAPGPVKLLPGGRYALNFAVEVAFLKYFAHIPLERQVQMMRHEGLRVTTAALCDQLDALATALANSYQAIWKLVQAEPVLRADETPWAVLSNGHTANERFYAWVAVGTTYVAYRLLDTRSADGAATILGDFKGTLVVDGLTSYPAAAKSKDPAAAPRFKVANCWAHARRKFIDAEDHYPVECKVVLDLIRDLYEVERRGREPGADMAALRAERSRPLVDRIFAWAREQQTRPEVLPASSLAKALGYLLNHEAGLRVFLEDSAVPIDNNESERAMRPPVLGRKNFYGSRSREATAWAAIIFTMVESAKRVGVSPRAYLEAAAEHALRVAGAVLLPEDFKRQLDAARDPPTVPV